MNAKHSAILLSGLLLLMIGVAWAQRSDTPTPTCPPLEDKILQDLLQPTAWVRANWNMNTSKWEIDCTQIDAIANAAVPAANSYNAMSNSAYNATNSRPPRSRGNSNYVNTNPYKAPPDTNIYTGPNANVNVRPATNAVKRVKREPNTRRPGN